MENRRGVCGSRCSGDVDDVDVDAEGWGEVPDERFDVTFSAVPELGVEQNRGGERFESVEAAGFAGWGLVGCAE